MREAIVVVVSGYNRLGGSFYTNSPVDGNWEDFVTHDVVSYVDSHYRTLAAPDARAIAGHSMGGFGALRLAMRYADIFSMVYGLSPALLAPGDLAKTEMFSSQAPVDAMLDMIDKLGKLSLDQAVTSFLRDYPTATQAVKYSIAYGAAFSPSNTKLPPFLIYPYHRENGQPVKDDAVWQAWQSGFGEVCENVQKYRDNWKKLKGIGLEYGEQDENIWLPAGVQDLSRQLEKAGIESEVTTFQGSHYDHLAQRIQDAMLPFLSQQLPGPS
jgi:S-formylglutathione hydrolase